MYHYSYIEWLLFFYFYSVCGWCFESTYVSIKSKRFVNRGFMKGPFLPLYGSGAIMMLVVSMPFVNNVVLVYIAGCIGATALEYVTGVTMEALFKVRYWDYSYKKYHFQGHICLSSTIAWGFMTVIMTYYIQKPVEKLVLSVPESSLHMIAMVATVFVVADYTLAFKAALDLRDILIKLEKAQHELELMQKRLDVMIAVSADRIDKVSEKIGRASEKVETKFERALSTVEAKLLIVRDSIMEKPALYLGEAKEEFAELRMKFGIYRANHAQLSDTLGAYKRSLIRNNPSMRSTRFAGAFEVLQKMAYRNGVASNDEIDIKTNIDSDEEITEELRKPNQVAK